MKSDKEEVEAEVDRLKRENARLSTMLVETGLAAAAAIKLAKTGKDSEVSHLTSAAEAAASEAAAADRMEAKGVPTMVNNKKDGVEKVKKEDTIDDWKGKPNDSWSNTSSITTKKRKLSRMQALAKDVVQTQTQQPHQQFDLDLNFNVPLTEHPSPNLNYDPTSFSPSSYSLLSSSSSSSSAAAVVAVAVPVVSVAKTASNTPCSSSRASVVSSQQSPKTPPTVESLPTQSRLEWQGRKEPYDDVASLINDGVIGRFWPTTFLQQGPHPGSDVATPSMSYQSFSSSPLHRELQQQQQVQQHPGLDSTTSFWLNQLSNDVWSHPSQQQTGPTSQSVTTTAFLNPPNHQQRQHQQQQQELLQQQHKNDNVNHSPSASIRDARPPSLSFSITCLSIFAHRLFSIQTFWQTISHSADKLQIADRTAAGGGGGCGCGCGGSGDRWMRARFLSLRYS